MTEPTLCLSDGYNLLHAAGAASRDELVDRLAGFVALRGARGIIVFDGVGDDDVRGELVVRYARSADRLLERLAAENRLTDRVCLISSDRAIRETAGQEVTKRSSKDFVAMLFAETPHEPTARSPRSQIEDALDHVTRARLERWRRRRA